ncbi:hypothetical protein GCM10010515_10220 [Streptomyces fructofermentans]|uniref:Uncharacterized protein n=1 Tax=Streptomyces fructofermentans TaxID=152141 RepID=A0A918K238_9ACTN|nr:hypothetical protein GCM10010515_10220 [Streptomyces fructofermentans]
MKGVPDVALPLPSRSGPRAPRVPRAPGSGVGPALVAEKRGATQTLGTVADGVRHGVRTVRRW